MAKYCTQCNLKYSNSAEKCVSCGAELAVRESDVKKKKIVIIALISVLLIAAIVVGIVIFTGPKAKVRQIIRSFKRGDVDAVISTLPEFLINSGEIDDYLAGQLPMAVSEWSEFKFSYNIDQCSSPSTKERSNVLQHLDSMKKYGYDSNKLEDMKVVLFSFTGTSPSNLGSGFDKYILIKYDGTWYWWPFDYN